MAGVDRLVQLAETQEKRRRSKDIAKALATLVALGFLIFLGYCIWLFMHETHTQL